MLRIHRLLLVASLLLLPWRAPAHDIPNDVTVHAFVKPEGTHLHLLVRVRSKPCAMLISPNGDQATWTSRV